MRVDVTMSEIVSVLQNRDERALLHCFEEVFLECRAISAQPQSDLSAGPALLTGLQSNFGEFQKLMSSRPYEFWVFLHEQVLRSGLSAVYQDVKVIDLIGPMLEIAQSGLRSRGYGEEVFLASLEQRIKNKQNPAEEALVIWHKGGLASLCQARDFC